MVMTLLTCGNELVYCGNMTLYLVGTTFCLVEMNDYLVVTR